MAKPRPDKTLADYVAIAISPALIMVLVGSLVFFLMEVVDTGQFEGRFKWVLFWFVFAAVLIARISIEEGSEHAFLFAAAFWGAVSLVLFKFLHDHLLAGYFLLGVVWWCAKQLTWDCTLIDDDQDGSGQGLLQITGLDPGEEGVASSQNGEAEKPAIPLAKDDDEKSAPDGEAEEDPAKRPHAPGLWVVYFSLAALPLFGIGQLFIPAADTARRTTAFRYLWVYVAAGLGLLLTTSFLGLRRYLRQRNLLMPGRMTARWIGMGAMLAVGILIACLILPRPNATYSVTKLVDVVSEKIGKASEHALGSDDAGEGEGRNAGREAKPEESKQNGEGQKGNDGQQAGQTSKTGQQASGDGGKKEGSSNTQGGQQSQQGDNKNSENLQQNQNQQGQQKNPGQQSQQNNPGQHGQQNNPGQHGQQNNSGQHGEQQERKTNDPSGGRGPSESEKKTGSSNSPQSQPASRPPIGSTITSIVKWLIYLAIAAVALYFAVKHWDTIKAALSRFIQDLKDLFASLFGRKPKPEAAPMEAKDLLKARPIKPFSNYANPFRSGQEQHMGTIELIAYTYDALQAWGAENGCPKRPDQTPTEYAQEIAQRDSDVAAEARNIAQLYLRAAFSTTPPSLECHKQLKQAWSRMEAAGTLA